MSDKKEKKAKIKKQKPELDTETTFADMNVDGIRGYDPRRKQKKQDRVELSKKEYWALVRGAYRAMFPLICCMVISGILIILLAYFWLK
jgi:hypothetical protein